MKIVTSIKQMQQLSRENKLRARKIGFVPTMGALHAGHLSLIRRARKENGLVVVSIFVNPIQFGPKEDFKKYPRPKTADIALCRKAKVDFIFYPSAEAMYPAGYKTYVTVEDLSTVLCGASRSGHFQGVATVVTKLLNIVGPNTAYFGQKDAQQAAIVRKLAEDLNIPVRITVMPIVRDQKGLALSSRNAHLNEKERRDALVLSQSLRLAEKLIRGGQKDAPQIIKRIKGLIRAKKNAYVDYVSIVDPDTLLPFKKISANCLVALAVWIGKTRLIDNLILNQGRFSSQSRTVPKKGTV